MPEETKHGYYSSKAADEIGYSIYQSSKEGKEVITTHISSDPPPVGVEPGRRARLPEYLWDDTIYQGVVLECVRTFPRSRSNSEISFNEITFLEEENRMNDNQPEGKNPEGVNKRM